MSHQTNIGVTIIDQFPVFAADGYTKVPGVTGLEISVWRNGVLTSLIPLVEDLGTGEYKVSFTPYVPGVWLVEVGVPLNGSRWAGTYQVIREGEVFVNCSYDKDTSILYAEIWMERSGEVVLAPVLGSIKVIDIQGIEVFSASTDVSSLGRFHFSGVVSLVTERVYSIYATATDSIGWINTYHSLSTSG